MAEKKREELEKIKKEIQTPRDEPGQPAEERRDYSEIIERLKKREQAKRPDHVSSVTADDIKKRVTGTTAGTPMDFDRKVHVEPQGGALGLVGGFYKAFQGPVSKIASALSSLPISRNLQSMLDTAGLRMSPETYLVLVTSASILSGLFVFLLFAGLSLPFGDTELAAYSFVFGGVVFFIVLVMGFALPSFKAQSRAAQIDRALPFALRQLATQIKAGVSFYRALSSVAKSDYGILSDEFNAVLSDLDKGLSTEEALLRLSNRTVSRGLKKTVMQIVRSFKSGGSLSEIISDIADDVSFETRMSIRDFTERLNFINIIYIMVAVVAPVAVTILSAIMQIPLFAGTFPAFFIPLSFVGIVMAMIMIMYLTKSMEPAAW
ncbi:MAG: type II secretion system F family protein [Candidatus Micrarchaeota archaeon]